MPAQSTRLAGGRVGGENLHAQKGQRWTLVPGWSCETQGPGRQDLLTRTAVLGLGAAGCFLGLQYRRRVAG